MIFESAPLRSVVLLLLAALPGASLKAAETFDSFHGLVIAGYQGWFNAPTDGAGQGWKHYSNDGKFEPGQCSIDFWPDMSEYEVKYQTPFVFADGSPAYVFSSYDPSTVELHFKWMAQYAIDGVFMQRFIHQLRAGGIPR
jgi:hypothetical protein